MRIAFVIFLFLAFNVNAWMDDWAPAFKCTPAKVKNLSQTEVREFFNSAEPELARIAAEYSKGGTLDLNGDGVDDFVYIIPWMGNGLCACGYNVHFVVSNGTKGWMKTSVEGYNAEMSDLVNVDGKTYFRQSLFFSQFEKSEHNHWVYQMYSFDANGVMKSANSNFGGQFPAVTIYYIKPRFKQIDLTDADLKQIEGESKPKSHKYTR